MNKHYEILKGLSKEEQDAYVKSRQLEFQEHELAMKDRKKAKSWWHSPVSLLTAALIAPLILAGVNTCNQNLVEKKALN